MISQIISVAAFFVCWVVATRFGGLIAPTIPLEAPWNQVTAMAIIFLITMIAIRFAYTVLEKLIRHWHLEKLNSLLGGLLGFTKGLLLCMIITFFAVMFSKTSRGIVFNSKTGVPIVHLITKISLFVPKDSYEFVHTQFAQFNSQVDKAVPGQTPETLRIQGSETVQQMLAQLQQTKEKTETGTDSLWNALTKWWKGSKDEMVETPPSTPQIAQKNEPSSPPAIPYTPPQSPTLPVNTYTSLPQPAVPKSVDPEDFLPKRINPVPASMEQLTALLPSAPEIPESSSSFTPLITLAPLTETLPILPESNVQLLPTTTAPHHVGSDLLLRNSTQPVRSDTSAKVFRSQ